MISSFTMQKVFERYMSMALTPEQIVNKSFRVTKFREGYDQDEVDDFLDEVVETVRDLVREIDELKRSGVSGVSSAQPGGSTTKVESATENESLDEIKKLRQELEQLKNIVENMRKKVQFF